MKHRRICKGVCTLVTIAAALGLVGCSPTVDVRSVRLLEAPATTPTDAAKVEILSREPLRPHVELGRITATPENNPDDNQIKEAIRNEAAKMGADAVVLGFEGEVPQGFHIEGMPGSAEARREMGRVVQATAIKYEAGGEGGGGVGGGRLLERLREREGGR